MGDGRKRNEDPLKEDVEALNLNPVLQNTWQPIVGFDPEQNQMVLGVNYKF